MKDYVHIKTFEGVAFIPRRLIMKLSSQYCIGPGVNLPASFCFLFIFPVGAPSDVRVLRLSAGEWVKWKRSQHHGTSSHDLLQKQDIRQLLFIYWSLSAPSDPAGAQRLWLAGKKLLCYCARWHGQLSVCVLWLQQLSCFQAISSVISTLALLIVPLKLWRQTFIFPVSVFKSRLKTHFYHLALKLWILFLYIYIF